MREITLFEHRSQEFGFLMFPRMPVAVTEFGCQHFLHCFSIQLCLALVRDKVDYFAVITVFAAKLMASRAQPLLFLVSSQA
jgi:hypothetical protein